MLNRAEDPLGLVLPDEGAVYDLFNGMYAEMDAEDVVHTRKCAGIAKLSAFTPLRLGAEDVAGFQDFAFRFFDEREAAAKTELGAEKLLRFEEIHKMMDELAVISTKLFFMEQYMSRELKISVEGLSDAKKEIASRIREKYSDIYKKFFTMLMRLRYLEGKLPQEGPQA